MNGIGGRFIFRSRSRSFQSARVKAVAGNVFDLFELSSFYMRSKYLTQNTEIVCLWLLTSPRIFLLGFDTAMNFILISSDHCFYLSL